MTHIDLTKLSIPQLHGLTGVSIAIGLLYCFLGYRMLKFILGLTGFLIAGSVAIVIIGWITEGHAISMIAAMLIGGASGAFALFFLFRVGVFSIGLLGAVLVANNILGDKPESWTPLAILGCGLGGGLIALIMERPVLSLATAAIGAYMIVSGGSYLIYGQEQITDMRDVFSLDYEQQYALIVWAVLAATGFFAQLSLHKDDDD